jgi:hypothetical protein
VTVGWLPRQTSFVAASEQARCRIGEHPGGPGERAAGG